MMLPTDAALMALRSRFGAAGTPKRKTYPVLPPDIEDRFRSLEKIMTRLELQTTDVQHRLSGLEEKLKGLEAPFVTSFERQKGNSHEH